ncbi:MAG: TIGR03088 family PEP-CTERM/XrtA system glycosyltransferase [Sedimenticola sp.]
MADYPKLIAHIIYRLGVGGLENGLINLINRIPQEHYHHAIICLTDYTDFASRITNPSVSLHALNKQEGKDLALYVRLWKLLRELRPDIVHTRNLAGIEASIIGWLAGVPNRVHGEHGRDSYDIDGTNKKYLKIRQVCQYFTQLYIPLSKDLEHWLTSLVMIPERKIRQIYNGVDSNKFQPASGGRSALPVEGFSSEDCFIVGTVGRIQEVKDQLTLLNAVAVLTSDNEQIRKKIRLVIVGDGPMMTEAVKLAQNLNIADITWFAGSRNDIPDILRGMDLFVLPSKAEGISNTILEAMASGLPVIATKVGGNAELVVNGETGLLVPSKSPDAMARAIEEYRGNPERCLSHGEAGRKRVEQTFSMESMVDSYMSVYDELLDNR